MKLNIKKRDMENTSHTSSGIGFTGLLTIVFITLKLTGYINWSWVWVLSPIWISLSLALILIAVLAIIIALAKK